MKREALLTSVSCEISSNVCNFEKYTDLVKRYILETGCINVKNVFIVLFFQMFV